MSTLYIRDVPDEVADELKRRAATEGTSLSALVTDMLTDIVRRPGNGEILRRVREEIGEVAVDREAVRAALDSARR